VHPAGKREGLDGAIHRISGCHAFGIEAFDAAALFMRLGLIENPTPAPKGCGQ
jgi:hypothetical protein